MSNAVSPPAEPGVYLNEIIEAHYYEAQLQWVGVILAPSVLRAVRDLANRGPRSGPKKEEPKEVYVERVRNEARIQRYSKIPVASDAGASVGRLQGFAVVPIRREAQTPEDLKDSMSTVLAKLQWLKQLAPDPRSQAKYQNTIEWLKELYDFWILNLK